MKQMWQIFQLGGITICHNLLADLGDQWEEEYADEYANDTYQGADNLFFDMNDVGENELGNLHQEIVRDYAVAFDEEEDF
jgi:hypothetical protein